MSNALLILQDLLAKPVDTSASIWRVISVVAGGQVVIEKNGKTQTLTGSFSIGQSVFVNAGVIVGIAIDPINFYEV